MFSLMKYIRTILANVRKADRDFSLIDDGDRIMLGISGGKDSLAMLLALSRYGFFAKKKFTIIPVFLDLGFGEADLSRLKAFCESLGTPLIVHDSRFVYPILQAHTKPGGHLPCSICSRMKKAAMNDLANELHCNKVAFAHHNDDAIETLFMNMVHGGRVATFEPKMHLDRARVTFIRPMIYCREHDIRLLAEEENLPVLESGCPANGFTEREWTKKLLTDLYRSHPEAKENFRTMLTNHEAFGLYFDHLEYECEDAHDYALKPIVSAKTMAAYPLKNRKPKEGEHRFVILHRHEYIGEICCRFESDHRVAIYDLIGTKAAKLAAVRQIEDQLCRKVNPLLFVLYGAGKNLATELGYEKRTEPGQLTVARYVKRRTY